MPETNKVVEIKGTFSVKQLIGAFVTVLTALGLLGTGFIQISGLPDTQATEAIVSSTTRDSLLLIEMRLLRADVRRLQIGYLEVQDNKSNIDTLARNQDELKRNQIRGFGALDEQNKMILNAIREIKQSLPNK